MKTMLVAGVFILSSLALIVLRSTATPFVSGHDAYAHYMPEGYEVKSWSCTVTVPAFGDYTYYAQDAYLRCSLRHLAEQSCPPWVPHQWCPAHVRLLATAPR